MKDKSSDSLNFLFPCTDLVPDFFSPYEHKGTNLFSLNLSLEINPFNLLKKFFFPPNITFYSLPTKL